MKQEQGFTLVELMATMALLSILMTLGVGALRYYWLGQSLTSERDEIFTNLRGLQQQAVSESNPLVFGAWFKVTTPATDDGSNKWGTFRYNPGDPLATPVVPATCTSTGQYRTSAGVQISAASFSDSLAGTTVTNVASACGAQIPAASGATDFALFLARGTATDGCVTLTQPNRDMDDVSVQVSQLTGRVEQVESCP